MMKSLFLTEIAKDYNTDIEAVEFRVLEKDMMGKVVTSKLRDAYIIYIDREKTKCVHRTMFVLFHEIAHIQLFHLGYKFYLSDRTLREAREGEADRWALKELGVIDNINRPTPDNISCHECLTTNSILCLKYKT
jgi:hypothetical protein